jgi:hypothetical protein
VIAPSQRYEWRYFFLFFNAQAPQAAQAVFSNPRRPCQAVRGHSHHIGQKKHEKEGYDKPFLSFISCFMTTMVERRE